MVFSRESGLFVSSPRSEKHTLHAILNAFALVSIVFGMGAVYLVWPFMFIKMKQRLRYHAA